jgi:tetratricopeptide (TPR) repeat protein
MQRLKRFFPETGLILILLLLHVPSTPQETGKKEPELTKKERRTVVEKMIPLLKDNYVFPEVGIKMGNHVNTLLKKGAFKAITDREEFAGRLTKELRSISHDKHIRVRTTQPRTVQREQKDPLLAWHLRQMREKKSNIGFKTVKVMDGNVGYLDFRYFSSNPLGKNVLAAAMAFLENTDAVIVDMRKNGGGSPAMVQLVCSYFFDKRVHLNSLYWRKGNITQEYWTLDKVDGKKRPEVPLFVLTSKRTFSGAEEFCYNMLTRKRATLVGEVTGGGAHPGGSFPITDRFRVSIPGGRAINPVTKTNWEGTGVKPDIQIDAEKALDKAHELAKKAANDFREKKVKTLTQKTGTLINQWEKAVELFSSNQDKPTKDQLYQILKKGLDSYLLNEDLVNNLGYTYLGQKKFELAIAVFTFNVKAFPKSFNVYDSLGEAYMEKGDNVQAITFYKKSLDINPNNANGRAMLEKLKNKAVLK